MNNPNENGGRPNLVRQGQLATQRRFVPEVAVINHLGQEFNFYSDLVKDRVVLVQMMSIHHEAQYPVARNLRRLQNLLGDLMGKEVMMLSVGVDPQFDSPVRLRHFARRYRAGAGWQFLTGNALAIRAIQRAFFMRSIVDINAGASPEELVDSNEGILDCSRGLLRYGNDALGLWGSVPAKADPAMIMERLSWLLPNPQGRPVANAGRLKRRGPFPNQHIKTGMGS